MSQLFLRHVRSEAYGLIFIISVNTANADLFTCIVLSFLS